MQRARYLKAVTVDTPIGRMETDSGGSAVGVAHLGPARSYAGIGELLQRFIDDGDKRAWQEITAKIDSTYEGIDLALGALEAETRFGHEVKAQVARGQKLFFKPNLVNILNIDPQTHGPDIGSTTCTEWPFVAALMRWFHDKLGISYHEMALGEAATTLAMAAGVYTMNNPAGKAVTTEAAIEGRAGDFYGGWGFYFARRYLAETRDSSRRDDPLQGYEESVAGEYIPPGRATDKLMVYDLNRIHDDPRKGRDVAVPDGVNFRTITLHKAIVGGDPRDPEDRKAYPGCVLVNVPKLKVHMITLLTNVVKNLGIGLYPMQAAEGGGFAWKYSVPHAAIPGMKGGLPHQVWTSEVDPDTCRVKRDAAGNYLVTKTGGIGATMADVVAAVCSQDVFMVHVVDAVEAINLDHQGLLPGRKEAEGMIFAGLDPVAVDLCCARYMFGNVPLKEAVESGLEDGAGGHFPQKVPVPTVEGESITTGTGYDCPIARDRSLAYAEARGLGKRQYYAVGHDVVTGHPVVSVKGHLGTVAEGKFSDLVTATLYFDAYKMPWDMQLTAFKYMEAVDELTGSSLKRDFLAAFDEDGDGVVSYEEFGRKGLLGPALHLGGAFVAISGTERLGYLRGPFAMNATTLRTSDPTWNAEGEDISREYLYGATCYAAYLMSQMPMEGPDFFVPSLTWGNGKWPSFHFASFMRTAIMLYGAQYPFGIGFDGLYGQALRYADSTQNGGQYAGPLRNQADPEGVSRYIAEVLGGQVKALDFTLYVPAGLGTVGGAQVPNVEETSDPAKMLTATFAGGKEVWPDTRLRTTGQ